MERTKHKVPGVNIVVTKCKLVFIKNDVSKMFPVSLYRTGSPVYTSLLDFLHVIRNILCHITKED